MIVPEQQRAHDAHQRFCASLAKLALPKPPSAAPKAPEPVREPVIVRMRGGRDFLWIATPPENRTATIKRIQAIVANAYNVSVLDILSERRTKVVVIPRQIAIYLARVLTPRSLPEIGHAFGNRDHTTALAAFNKIKHLMSADPAFAAEVEELARMVSVPKTNPGELGSSGA